MAEWAELVEAGLNAYAEGLARVSEESQLVFWTFPAKTITENPNIIHVPGRALAEAFEPLTWCAAASMPAGASRATLAPGRGPCLRS